MKILAIEFSSAQRSVALLDGPQAVQGGVADLNVAACVAETGSSKSRAMPMIERALNEAGWDRRQIDTLAVGLGPGSYTGIRAAISLAQGWRMGQNVEIRGIGSMDSLAARAQAAGWRDRTHFVMDAQRGEFYMAGYDFDAQSAKCCEPLHLVAKEAVLKILDKGGHVAGPEISRWFPSGLELFPDAVTAGLMAARNPKNIPGEQLEPIYLRAIAFVKAPTPRHISTE
jgi:tRNA threonylcarbamoyladenosine biosynthesis protein TsaB